MRVWTVSEEKAGTLTQCLGVALNLTPEPIVHKIGRLPHWRRGLFSPYRSLTAAEPDVVISCGLFAERHVAQMKAHYGGRPLAVHLQPPVAESTGVYDLAFVSRHDWRMPRFSGTQYHTMIGVPHRVTRALLSERREEARRRLMPDGTDSHMVALLLGGPNGAYDYERETIERLVAIARQLSGEGWRVFVSTSRRSPPQVLEAFLGEKSGGIHVWDRTGDNPYLDYLAAADAFLISKDTVTMHCEALMSGRPVYSLDLAAIPGERHEKFEWLHADLQDTLELTRPFQGSLAPYAYRFVEQAAEIAETIRAELDVRNTDVQAQ